MSPHYTPWIQPGVTPWESEEFLALSWLDGKRFMEEIAARVNERIAALELCVRATPGYESWRADGSDESLARLGEWFLVAVPRRAPTPEELELLSGVKVLNPDLPPAIIEDLQRMPTTRSWVYVDDALARSVLLDIGLYMARCLLQIRPDLQWSRSRNKRDMEYNMPVLTAFGLNFNPFWVPANTAARMCDGREDHLEFLRAFKVYERMTREAPVHPPEWIKDAHRKKPRG